MSEGLPLNRPTRVNPLMHGTDYQVRRVFLDIFLVGAGRELALPIPFLECSIFAQNLGGTNWVRAGPADEPIANPAYGFLVVLPVNMDVPAGYVRKCLLVVVAGPLEDQDHLFLQQPLAITATPMINSELKRHVHASVFASGHRFAAAEVMDGKLRSADSVEHPVEASSCVIRVLGS